MACGILSDFPLTLSSVISSSVRWELSLFCNSAIVSFRTLIYDSFTKKRFFEVYTHLFSYFFYFNTQQLQHMIKAKQNTHAQNRDKHASDTGTIEYRDRYIQHYSNIRNTLLVNVFICSMYNTLSTSTLLSV